MNRAYKSPFLLLAAGCMYLCISQYKAVANTPVSLPVKDSTCLVKTDDSYDFPENMRKKVFGLIEDKLAGGIDENGKVTWENSPEAPEYYQVVLRKNKVAFKYKGTVCQDRLIWENFEACRQEVKKLLNK
ncbi:hypothetical protein [Chitinophaga nivalis]|uniref:Uncharacterized protein n=1 Tax=Chitinophaga nivalis TaxID=2991709 RepID=A0ABT3IEB5_9BACT|nr:hypothetical protein [Chitinophaga nivalis]MCW3468012.1 hypothetical protein [Chitinophaga nivalis]MCW3482297.1 hypothetical protein [Chitinophaga nivalis]